MLAFQLTCMKTQKRGNTSDEYEDAYAFSRGMNRFTQASKTLRIAMADGATEGAFAQQWAKLLVDDYVRRPYVRRGAMLRHSRDLAAKWKRKVWKPGLPWYIEERIRIGAFSTLLGLRIRRDSGDWKAISIGDTCGFQIRNDKLILAWPLGKTEDFGRFPALLSTNNAALENVGNKVVTTNGQANMGDIFVLATDALSAWFLEQNEKGKRPWLTLMEDCLCRSRSEVQPPRIDAPTSAEAVFWGLYHYLQADSAKLCLGCSLFYAATW